jgi:excisionase family DNA binding protein
MNGNHPDLATQKKKRGPRVPTPFSRLVPSKEAARMLGLSYTTWRTIAAADRLPTYKFGRLYYFARTDIDQLVERHREHREQLAG